MKVLVITGSPRKKGNSFAMVEAFVNEAEKLGHSVKRFDAAFMKIGGCHACQTCFKTGKACSFDDDFNIIAPAIMEADAIVFAMPVYWYSIPSQIKGVIDRIFSFCVAGKDISGKKCCLITCCEEHDPHRHGRSARAYRAFGGTAEVGDGRRGARSRRTERGRHQQYGRLSAG